jgi:hypothetical protein
MGFHIHAGKDRSDLRVPGEEILHSNAFRKNQVQRSALCKNLSKNTVLIDCNANFFVNSLLAIRITLDSIS